MVVIMIKLHSFLLSGLVISSQLIGASADYSIYYKELKDLKKRPEVQILFDEDAHSGLSAIQRDIMTRKELGFFQRLARFMFLGLDVIVATPDTMPKLYAYVNTVSEQGRIITPTVFVTRKKGFFNAMASKLLMSTGGIVIGQKLLHDSSDEQIEAIVAHEIGHIKHNHVNKSLALSIVTRIIASQIGNAIISENGTWQNNMAKYLVVTEISSMLSALIINKRFEKEADLFACQCGKSNGIVSFFEFLQKKEQQQDDEFPAVLTVLEQNKAHLSHYDYSMLSLRYYLAKISHEYGRFVKYLYHETPLGAHPSHQARIDAAKAYLAQQQA